MRKLALLTTALLGLAFVEPTFAQPNQAGPQPGLPPGAGVGAVNAIPPRATGQIATTPTGPAAMPMADMSPPPARATRHRARHRRHAMRHHRAHRYHAAPAMAAPAAQ